MKRIEHLIDGRWRKGHEHFEVLNPADDEPVTSAPIASEEQVTQAVDGARRATGRWARTSPAERGQLIQRIAALVEDRAEELADFTHAEMGRPHQQAVEGVLAGAGTLRQYAELGPLHRGKALAGEGAAIDLMRFEPRGVVAAITPWNDPVAVSCGLLGAALVTGNTVVYKPSERTPGTGWALARVFDEVLPDGVLSLLNGPGEVGRALVGQPVDVVAHVGSSETGRAIARHSRAPQLLLENGGNDPLIVDAGVDPEWAAEQAALGAFANSGQACVSVERIYVHESIADPFLTHLAKKAQEVELGPLVDRAHREQVHGHVRGSNARILCGGDIPPGPGAFYPATVLADCSDDMAVMREETFGPVAPVATVRSFDEALVRARTSPYGLSATVLTGSMHNAQRAVVELPVGTLRVNGVFKGAPGGAAHPRGISGRGFGYGPELLDEMTFTKVIHMEPLPEAV